MTDEDGERDQGVERLVDFGRALRAAGLPVGTGRDPATSAPPPRS